MKSCFASSFSFGGPRRRDLTRPCALPRDVDLAVEKILVLPLMKLNSASKPADSQVEEPSLPFAEPSRRCEETLLSGLGLSMLPVREVERPKSSRKDQGCFQFSFANASQPCGKTAKRPCRSSTMHCRVARSPGFFSETSSSTSGLKGEGE